VNNLRKINTGHPETAAQLISDNVKEMSNPTRDGRAMIAAAMIHPAATPTARPTSPAPSVTIGAIRVSNRPASSAGGTQDSPYRGAGRRGANHARLSRRRWTRNSPVSIATMRRKYRIVQRIADALLPPAIR
jgi:hypothetical protein